MSSKLKTTSEDTLKGTGFNSMGWTESGRNLKNVKRMMSTFDDVAKSKPAKKERIKVCCTSCGANLTVVKGTKELQPHARPRNYARMFSKDDTTQDGRCANVTFNFVNKQGHTIYDVKSVKFVEIDGQKIKIGDTIVYTKRVSAYGLKIDKQVFIKKINKIDVCELSETFTRWTFSFDAVEGEANSFTVYSNPAYNTIYEYYFESKK